MTTDTEPPVTDFDSYLEELAREAIDPDSPEARAEEEHLIQAAGRGQLARDVLENPLIKQFFRDMEAEIWQRFRATPALQPQLLQEQRREVEVLDQFQQFLQFHLQTGQLARRQLQQLDQRRQRWFHRLRRRPQSPQ